MPYITQRARVDIDEALSKIEEYCGALECLKPGEFNYFITRILLMTRPNCYEDYNKLIGVLECAKLELYRRAVVPHEEKKMEENGDVY